MQVVVIGLGSMGKRRIRLLIEYIKKEVTDPKAWRIVGVDSNKERCDETENLYGVATFQTLQEAVEAAKIDAAVISTSPISHAKIVEECLNNDLHVFTEINLISDGYRENIELAKEKNKILFLSSTPMYRREMQYIKEQVTSRKFNGTYHYHIGQYLPEWHPWESYKSFFVGNKRTNGCRELFAIELPWLIDTFGEVADIYSIHIKSTELEIDYDDIYQVIIRHSSGVVGNLSIDIVTPKAGREFEMWEENFYLEWKGTPDTLKRMDAATKELQNIELYDDIEHVEGYNKFVVENAYYDELRNYILSIIGIEQPKYSFIKDFEVINIIDRIEGYEN